ncbi:hypothetical protein [Gracilibacillus sp. YIM 98692]|uniref:hypothetical protein n=1 Tax=Gracilibacillus sp. YIM 98692 TaxID=2663532 RepID=UPI0013D6A3A7|nr:hypothetical protein [Gracilibacillus sp. YIM 98692]
MFITRSIRNRFEIRSILVDEDLDLLIIRVYDKESQQLFSYFEDEIDYLPKELNDIRKYLQYKRTYIERVKSEGNTFH